MEFNNVTQLNNYRLESSRLFVHPLTLNQLLWYKHGKKDLESDLGVLTKNRKIADEFLFVIEISNIPYLTMNPDKVLYGTLWMIIEREKNIIIGDIGFKGAPTESGVIEVGYGIDADFRNNGYMTEALNLLCNWAFTQPEVKIIIAETDKSNLASQRTLKKNNFIPFAETDLNYYWRLDREQY